MTSSQSPNLILSDYLEFRYFVDSELRAKVRIAEEVRRD